jgi:hypothetical protein
LQGNTCRALLAIANNAVATQDIVVKNKQAAVVGYTLMLLLVNVY